MWLFHFFICNPAASIINIRACLNDSANKSLEGTFCYYCYLLIYLLDLCAIDEFVSEALNDIKFYTQALNATIFSNA